MLVVLAKINVSGKPSREVCIWMQLKVKDKKTKTFYILNHLLIDQSIFLQHLLKNN